MNRNVLLALSLLPLVPLASCGRVSVYAHSSDPETNRTLERGGSAAKTIYNGWSIYDAWDDAIDKISPHDEVAVGQLTALSVITQVGDLVLEDEALVRYVNSVGNHIALQGERQVKKPRMQGRRFFFGILRSPEANAFSTPGGNVLVTTGLLQKLNSESELAFVLAHEIAHVDHEHGLLALKGAVKSDEALKSSLQLLLRKDKDKEPVANLFEDLNVFEKSSLKMADLIVSKGNLFSAGQERDADATGIEYAMAAGYEPRGGIRVLEALRDGSGNLETMSHGKPQERIDALVKKIGDRAGGKTGFSRWQENGLARLEGVEAKTASAASDGSAP